MQDSDDEVGAVDIGDENGATQYSAPYQEQPKSAPAVSSSSSTLDPSEFLMKVATPGELVHCTVRRRKASSFFKGEDQGYELFQMLGGKERFLASARKKKQSKHPSYEFSLDRLQMMRPTDSVSNKFGKLKANYMTTNFSVLSPGANPAKMSMWDDEFDRPDGVRMREELCKVDYHKPLAGLKGTSFRSIHVSIPKVDAAGERLSKEALGSSDLHTWVLDNAHPLWNPKSKAYEMTFLNGSMKASCKNFQLLAGRVATDAAAQAALPGSDTVVLEFGKTSKEDFVLIYSWPLTGLQAFGIALSAFNHKLAYV